MCRERARVRIRTWSLKRTAKSPTVEDALDDFERWAYQSQLSYGPVFSG